MLTPVKSLSSTAALSLLGASNSNTSSASSTTSAGNGFEKMTGNTDDLFKAGAAIGKIIEIVAAMKSSSSSLAPTAGQRVYDGVGGYSETTIGQHASEINDSYALASKQRLAEASMDLVKRQAQGTGPEAERAKALVAATQNGTIQEIDMTPMGVTVTATITKYYDAHGKENGMSGTWDVRGLDDFMQKYTYRDDGGQRRDKATGKYASFSSDGNKYTYVLF